MILFHTEEFWTRVGKASLVDMCGRSFEFSEFPSSFFATGVASSFWSTVDFGSVTDIPKILPCGSRSSFCPVATFAILRAIASSAACCLFRATLPKTTCVNPFPKEKFQSFQPVYPKLYKWRKLYREFYLKAEKRNINHNKRRNL